MKIIDLGMNGEGIARKNGKVFFVEGGLPGEDVEVKIVKESKNFSLAKIEKIVKSSEFRETPLCPYFEECGGCNLQHLRYDKQLEFKQKLVKNTIKKISGIDCDVDLTIPSEKIYNYRCKNVFPICNGRIGMYKNDSKDFIDIDECKIADERINKILSFCKSNVDNEIKFLVVQNGVVSLVVEEEKINIEKIEKVLRENNIPFNVNINPRTNERILSDRFIHITDNPVYKNAFGIDYEVNAGSFEQINENIRDKIYKNVCDNVSEEDVVLDAYCGGGLMSSIVAQKCKECLGVEIYAPAIESAKDLAERNNINNLSFICGDCAKIISTLRDKFSVVILDPPRKGCGEKFIKELLRKPPSKIIYVSCSPISLAKELKLLCEEKYKIDKVIPYDMFPQTKHVETFVILKLRNN